MNNDVTSCYDSGEMLALTLNDFDFDAKTFSITKNYARHEGEDLIMEPR